MKQVRMFGILTGLLVLLILTVPASAFSDMEAHWAQENVVKWSEEYGVLSGYDDGTFRPNASITRGAFAVIVNRFMQYQTPAKSDVFSDTKGTWCEDAVLKMNQADVMLGNGGRALIWDTITRQEAITMIARAFQIEPLQTSLTYADANEVAKYATGYLSALTDEGCITNIKDNCFRPREPITRAEVVSLLDKMVEVMVKNPGVYVQNTDGNLLVNADGEVELRSMTVTGDLILAPGVTGPVRLTDVTIGGALLNFSAVTPIIIETTAPPPVYVPELEETDEEDKPVDEDKPVKPDEDDKPNKPDDNENPETSEDEEQTIEYKGRFLPILQDVPVSDLTTDDFIRDNKGRLVCTSDRYTTRFGIDVSRYQGEIDWKAVAHDGVEFAFIRVGGRGYSEGAIFEDANYEANLQGAMENGIETGVYFFAQAITPEEAEEEAEFVLDILEEYPINGPVVYDWEMMGSDTRTYGIEPEMVNICVETFCDKLNKAGFETVVYFTNYVGYTKYDLFRLKDNLLWYANYSYNYPNFYYAVDYWQYSSKGTVDGIKGDVDCNLHFIPKK